ncbi:MAG TPA: 50S ribosomal protein L3 N(5)-glutamine methyltransferase [Gammaproteobacteria bacterium]|nr:50S ribosomal protein L3 N(5)-glutamine methyltransferase [Gammaproteobacteria bacterium]
MQDQPELKTLRDLVRFGASRFGENGLHFGHGTDNALDEARVLVTHALHLAPGLADGWLDARVTAAEREAVLALFDARIRSRKPAAYLTGEAWFAGLAFHVDERVLVPRSPLAEWIERGFQPWLEPARVQRVLDHCTGSGCIAIACAAHFEQASVDATDISADALEVARRNVARHQLEDWVRLVQSDLFEALEPARYDLIISNPPYVPDEEMQTLPAEYRHEPEIGLRAERAGLDVVVRLLAQASDWLAEDGILVVEVGNSEEMLVQCFPEVPFVWLDFERGGHGVLLLEAQVLREYRSQFEHALQGTIMEAE